MTPQSAAAAPLDQPLQNGERPSYNVTLRINQRAHALSIDPRTTLLDAIRDHVGLTGTKKGCGHGQCGACTVLPLAQLDRKYAAQTPPLRSSSPAARI